MSTIIVPAHNEATVIQRCLDSIIKQDNVSHIIVACNGCSDNTAQIVLDNYPDVHCLDIKTPSKTNALNEAEEKAAELGIQYPIFYIDADTILSENAISTVIEQMDEQNILLAAPTPKIDTSKSSWFVKQYYKVWTELPYIKAGVIATCSFIISETGRQRFKKFADVINDDGYVRCHFKNSEIANIKDCHINISAPRTLYSLIKIKTRARLGNQELKETGQCPIMENKHYGSVMKQRLFSKHFIQTFIYLSIATVIRIRAQYQYKTIENYQWEIDTSSRE